YKAQPAGSTRGPAVDPGRRRADNNPMVTSESRAPMNSPTDTTAPPPVHLAHLSDVHITTSPLGRQPRDWVTKRVPGYINLRWLGRRRRFRSAAEVLAALVSDIRRRRPDHVIFSGDATNLGFEAEFARAAALLGLGGDDPLPGLAVPGNHDYY